MTRKQQNGGFLNFGDTQKCSKMVASYILGIPKNGWFTVDISLFKWIGGGPMSIFQDHPSGTDLGFGSRNSSAPVTSPREISVKHQQTETKQHPLNPISFHSQSI